MRTPLDRLACFVFGEFERTRAENILFVPARILVENVLLVDKCEGVGERWQEGIGREFEMEDDSRRIGCLDLVDHFVPALTRAQHACRRVDDHLPAFRDIGSGQCRAIVEFDVAADLERISLAAVGRLRHRGAEVADKVGCRGRVFGVDPDQYAVKRGDRMQSRKGALAMAVKTGRGVLRDYICKGSAALCRRFFVGGAGSQGCSSEREDA